ncbi:cathepsin B-like cysteine proteinase 4 [Planococcus citri]|uniref:cathepsin B-like cysteine proteinase 4 n=1 Tax=Planococcus citri TaxID=170843 RepID=UPI0031F7E7BC
MKFQLYIAIIFLITTSVLTNHEKKINLREIAAEVNSDRTLSWKASAYGQNEVDISEIMKKFGAKFRKSDQLTSIKFTNVVQNETKVGFGSGYPTSYDAREEYPHCPSISHIRDQSTCGSCWAVSAASVFSDRLCIHSNGKYTDELSSRFMLSCDNNGDGCKGGYLDMAWEFLKKRGTLTGGEFGSKEGCQPYPFPPYVWYLPFIEYSTPQCLENECNNESYEYDYEPDLIKARDIYHVGDFTGSSINAYYIQDEILNNGPVQAFLVAYLDLLTYQSGIYRHYRQRGQVPLAGHAVKIIGWGEEFGVKYWLISNSWGENWGEKGTFRMIRGENHCNIETGVYAGIPEL